MFSFHTFNQISIYVFQRKIYTLIYKFISNQCIDFALKNIDTELIEQVERRHNGRGGMSRRLRTGFEDDEKEKDEE